MTDDEAVLHDLESQGLVGEPGVQPIPPPTNPMGVARRLASDLYTDHGKLLLRAHRGDFYRWDGTCWPEAEGRGVRGAMYEYLEAEQHLGVQDEQPSTTGTTPPWRLSSGVKPWDAVSGPSGAPRLTSECWLASA